VISIEIGKKKTHRSGCGFSTYRTVILYVGFTLGFACPYPAPPPNDTNIAPLNYTGKMIARNASLIYGCTDGKKFEQDFDLDHVTAMCVIGYNWTEPDNWGNCVDSTLKLTRHNDIHNDMNTVMFSSARSHPLCLSVNYF
jgi:hypothetical protein